MNRQTRNSEGLKVSISLTVKKLREEKALSRETLAQQAGLDPETLVIMEDEHRPSLTHLIRVAEGLGIRLSELIRMAEEGR